MRRTGVRLLGVATSEGDSPVGPRFDLDQTCLPFVWFALLESGVDTANDSRTSFFPHPSLFRGREGVEPA